MMQSCASAAKFRAAGHSLGRHQVPCSNTAFRHLGSSYRRNLGDGLRDQAAAVWDCEDAGLAATSIPSMNLTP